MYRLVIILLVLTSGCTTLNPKKIVSPSEHLYYEGNLLYDNKAFLAAIEKYELFLEKNPQPELTTAAKLNLGMSYYYSGELGKACKILKNVNVNDANLKNFLNTIITECSGKEDTAAGEQETEGGAISINVTEAYLDDSGSLVLKGKLSVKSQLYVNEASVDLDENNTFSATVSWKTGTPVLIVAQKGANQQKVQFFPDSEEPRKPENIRTVSATSNTADLEWDDNPEDDIKGYKLYYGLKGGEKREVPEIIKNTRYEIVGLSHIIQGANRTFQIYLRAVDKMNNYSSPSNTFEVTLP